MTPDEFRRIRKELGLTQEELAKKMGLQQPAISRIERGYRPTRAQALHLRALKTLHALGRLPHILFF